MRRSGWEEEGGEIGSKVVHGMVEFGVKNEEGERNVRGREEELRRCSNHIQIWSIAVEGRVFYSRIGRTVERKRRDRRELPQSTVALIGVCERRTKAE